MYSPVPSLSKQPLVTSMTRLPMSSRYPSLFRFSHLSVRLSPFNTTNAACLPVCRLAFTHQFDPNIPLSTSDLRSSGRPVGLDGICHHISTLLLKAEKKKKLTSTTKFFLCTFIVALFQDFKTLPSGFVSVYSGFLERFFNCCLMF